MNEVTEVFGFWKELMGHERAQLGEKRTRAIRKALRMGYSVEDLQLAILGCKVSPFHQGQNDRDTSYDDIELICRDEIHIDKFIRLGEERIRQEEVKREKEKADSSLGVPMPDSVRAKLDAMLGKYRKPVRTH